MRTKICEKCGGTILTGFVGNGKHYDYCDRCGRHTADYDPDNEPSNHVWFEPEE
jgi:uncharacterized protein (DUF983 family)